MIVDMPIREMKQYQTDDGKRIERYELVGHAPTEITDDTDDSLNLSKEKLLFLGIIQLNFQDASKDLKFLIPEVATIEEAFAKYVELAPKVVEEIRGEMNRQEEQVRKQSSGIVTASEADLGAMGSIGGLGVGADPGIIQPGT